MDASMDSRTTVLALTSLGLDRVVEVCTMCTAKSDYVNVNKLFNPYSFMQCIQYTVHSYATSDVPNHLLVHTEPDGLNHIPSYIRCFVFRLSRFL